MISTNEELDSAIALFRAEIASHEEELSVFESLGKRLPKSAEQIRPFRRQYLLLRIVDLKDKLEKLSAEKTIRVEHARLACSDFQIK